MKNRGLTRALSIVLSAAMLVSSVPTSAFAESRETLTGGENRVQTEVQDGAGDDQFEKKEGADGQSETDKTPEKEKSGTTEGFQTEPSTEAKKDSEPTTEGKQDPEPSEEGKQETATEASTEMKPDAGNTPGPEQESESGTEAVSEKAETPGTDGKTGTEAADPANGKSGEAPEDAEMEEKRIRLEFQVRWEDQENFFGVRPEPELFLYVDGEKAEEDTYAMTLVKAEQGIDTYEIKELPAENEGVPIAYTIREKEIPGYESVVKCSETEAGKALRESGEITFDPEQEYRAESWLENSLLLWTVQGSILWPESAQPEGVSPADCFAVTDTAGQPYESCRAEYTVEEDTPFQWDYTLTFPAIDHRNGEKTALYLVDSRAPEGYEAVTGAINGLQVSGSLRVEERLEFQTAAESGTEESTGPVTEPESETEEITEAMPEPESGTEESTEPVTEPESETEEITEAVTEPESGTEESTEPVTEPESETEEITEAMTEPEFGTEESTEPETEPESETEGITEAVTETENRNALRNFALRNIPDMATVKLHYGVSAANGNFTFQVTYSDNTPYTGAWELISSGSSEASHSGTTEDGSITVPASGDGMSLQLTELDPAKTSVTVSLTETAGLQVCAGAASSIWLGSNQTQVDFYLTGTETVTLFVDWNDNSDEEQHRPAAEDCAFQLTFLAGSSYTTLDDSNKGTLGLEAVPSPAADTTSSFNNWIYTYARLPQYAMIEGSYTRIGYGITHPSVEDYLMAWEQTEPDRVSYTHKVHYEASMLWLDNSDGYGTRISVEGMKAHLALKRYVSGQEASSAETVTEENVLVISPEAGNTDTWKLTLQDLPAYDASGMPYVYYMEQLQSEEISQNSDEGEYVCIYGNVGNYASDTVRLYSGGTITNTLTATTDFAVNKIWLDGKAGTVEEAGRPDAMLYLYRFAEGEGDFESASPVQGYDKVAVTKKDGAIAFTSANHTLPKFDAHGRKYIYFAKERGLTGDYKAFVDNSGSVIGMVSGNSSGEKEDAISKYKTDAEAGNYILNQGTVTNKLDKDEEIEGTKILEAASIQGLTKDFSVTLRLQRRLTGAAAWEDVTTEPVGAGERALRRQRCSRWNLYLMISHRKI